MSPKSDLRSAGRDACFGDAERALPVLHRLRREHPRSGVVWLLLGTAYRRLHRGRDARLALGVARARMPGEGEVDYEIGLSLIDDDRYGEAEWYFDRAADSDPADPRYRTGLALTALAGGRTSRAGAIARGVLRDPGCRGRLADACGSIVTAAKFSREPSRRHPV